METEYTSTEKKYMDSLSFTKSKQVPHINTILGKQPDESFPYPELLSNVTLYDFYGKPHTLVAQPDKSDVEISEEMYLRIMRWGMNNQFLIDIDFWPSWPKPDLSHVIEMSHLPH